VSYLRYASVFRRLTTLDDILRELVTVRRRERERAAENVAPDQPGGGPSPPFDTPRRTGQS
jgi:hypothetical protein